MSQLPDTPESGADSYFKPSRLAEGKSLDLRILGPAIAFMLAWKARKPVRKNYGEGWNESEFDAADAQGRDQRPRLAWAFPIYNYERKRVQVWEITQATIRTALRALVNNKRWGDLEGYGLSIVRSGSGTETEYSVQPFAEDGLPPEVAAAWADARAAGFDLNALMVNGDPFTGVLVHRGTASNELLDPPFDEEAPAHTDAEAFPPF